MAQGIAPLAGFLGRLKQKANNGIWSDDWSKKTKGLLFAGVIMAVVFAALAYKNS